MSNRSYNHVYYLGSFTLQIMLNGAEDGLCVHLLPQLSIGINNRLCRFAMGLEWICGCVNIGWMQPAFKESQKKRIKEVQDLADKAGLTYRQQELRWGW